VLRSLQIKHFAIADSIELDFTTGLSVLTGETGAGKSIIIRALGLVLGQRADSNMVKHNRARAEIVADFDIHRHPLINELLQSLELDEDGECLLRRVVNADSGSQAYVNGRRVTASILRRIGEQLIDIHGQHEHQSLLRSGVQQTMLDQYAGLAEKVSQLRTVYAELKQAIAHLDDFRNEADAEHEKRAFLSYQLNELEQFSPQPGEWQTLQARHQRIHHQAELGACVLAAEQLLFGGETVSDDANTQLGRAISELEKASAIDPALGEITDLLSEAQTLMNESELSLRHASESLSLDEAELAEIEQRYTGYLDFARKHRVEAEQLYDCFVELSTQIEQFNQPENSEAGLLARVYELAEQYQKMATPISKQRKQAADTLSRAISQSMQGLAMEGGEFLIRLVPYDSLPSPDSTDRAWPHIGHSNGNEKIEFEVSTNTGMPAQALSKVASGGELSRISLAMQMILSDLSQVETLVFDEVDVGVGGKTAAVIGKMLAQLADTRQILCITHLPQVAAFGDSHFHVNKQQGQQVSLTIARLDDPGRIQEIARMVGGEQITEQSLAHAQDLLSKSHEQGHPGEVSQ